MHPALFGKNALQLRRFHHGAAIVQAEKVSAISQDGHEGCLR
jgi:hypothetical protein